VECSLIVWNSVIQSYTSLVFVSFKFDLALVNFKLDWNCATMYGMAIIGLRVTANIGISVIALNN
jgi:hypothetical protein